LFDKLNDGSGAGAGRESAGDAERAGTAATGADGGTTGIAVGVWLGGARMLGKLLG
jgi:hypothetical protein